MQKKSCLIYSNQGGFIFMISKRSFYLIIIFLFTSIVFGLTLRSGESSNPPENSGYFPRLGNYTDLYLRGSYEVLHMIKVRELGKIGTAAKEAAKRKMAGGKIISAIGTPHIMYAGACADDVPGNPNIAPDPKNQYSGYQGDPPLGRGDVLFTANPTPAVEEAHNRGCYVVGIGFPMTTNRYSPSQFNDHPNEFIEEMSDIFIYTWGPMEDGLVTPAMTPNLKILPTSPMTVVAYWLITAQLAHNLAYGDTSGSYAAAGEYIDTLMARLDEFHYRYSETIVRAGEMIADRVLAGGKIRPWSGRDEFWIEANGTAGGLMGVYPLNRKPDLPYAQIKLPEGKEVNTLSGKDVVILAAADSIPDKEIEMAQYVKKTGAWLLGIFPFKREDGYSTAPLRELCDVSLDNMSGDKFGVQDIPGYPNKIIPTTAIMNNFAFWAVVGAYVQAMERRGVAPYYWMSFHVPGGKAYDDSIRPYFLKRGY